MRHLAVIPHPGRGHVNPTMNLCRLLLASSEGKDLLISFIVTEEWRGLISSSGDPPPPQNLRLVSIPNTIPSEFEVAKDVLGFMEAVATKMEGPVSMLMDSMEQPVEGILADTLLSWAVALGRRRNIPVYSVFIMSAAFFLDNLQAAAVLTAGEEDEKHTLGRSLNPKASKQIMEAFSMVREVQGILISTFYELEPEVIDALRESLHCPVYPIGPSIPYMALDENAYSSDFSRDVDYFGWLNMQPKQSVLYVSLGSFLTVSDAQMDEIARGLRLSGTRFLWVARGDASRLQQLAGGMGKVLPWCDQLKVLNHSSVGGFLTHCGWNSTMEAVFCGVPMITLPIIADQPINRRLIVEKWKVGLSLGGENGRQTVVGHGEVSSVVERLMDLDGAESKDMRKRIAQLRDLARDAIAFGGSTTKNLRAFVGDLIRKGSNGSLGLYQRHCISQKTNCA